MGEIYKIIVGVGFEFALTLAVVIFVTGILRLIWLYAFAEPITIKKDPAYSSIGFRTIWRIMIMLGWEDEDEDVKRPYGADVRGIGIDILLAAAGITILFAIWPVTLSILVGYFPIQTMHEYHAKKKEFVANLKGEQLENA